MLDAIHVLWVRMSDEDSDSDEHCRVTVVHELTALLEYSNKNGKFVFAILQYK